jgi:hypothetical protein
MPRKVLFMPVIAAVCIAGVFVARSKTTQESGLVRLTYVETTHLPDGQIRTKGKRVRVVERSTGQYKETYYGPDGQEKDFVLVSKQGVFIIRKGIIQPTDEFQPPPPESFTGESVKKNAVGTAQILGYTSYIKKSASGSVEVWAAPELGSHIPLKVIMYGGDNSFTQLEAVNISQEPAPPAGFFDPPDLPVDVSKIERALEAAQTGNDQRGIERYNRLLAKWKR